MISLQLTAFWHNHHNAIIAAAAAGTCYATWRLLLAASGVRESLQLLHGWPTLPGATSLCPPAF